MTREHLGFQGMRRYNRFMITGTGRLAGWLMAAVACLGLMGCQTIEATGERHLTLIGEQQEINMGRSSNEDIVKTMGLYPDEELQAYVQRLGSQVAATTERPELPWTFQVVDDDVVNAFALPGGYVYFTRGILAHFENEAQLVGVLGHEIAHVTAKHSVVRLSKSMVAQLGLGVAMVAVPELQDLAPMLSQGMQLLFLKFSRDDETESDMLGIRYMRNVNQDPRELAEVMEMLGRLSEAREGGMVPQWASTHPHPENRVQAITTRLNELPDQDYEPVGREGYLRRLEGMVYGKNPREGFFKEAMFYHPELRFQLGFPQGWKTVNQRTVLVGVSPRQDAVIQLSVVKEQDPQGALHTLFRQEGIEGLSSSRTSVNGLSAATGEFQARTDQGVIQGRATFVLYDGRLYQMVGYSPQRVWREYDRLIRQAMGSFDRLDDPRYLRVEPLRLEIVRVSSPVTLREFHEDYGVPVEVDELARLNQLEVDERIPGGSLVKRVVGERP